MTQDNISLYLALFAKYAPTVLKIIQTDGPVIAAFLKDLQAIQAGQAPSSIVPGANLAAPKGHF
jgi:hypothetical protein